MKTWGFSAERVGKKPTLFVRGYFWVFNLISDLVSLIIL